MNFKKNTLEFIFVCLVFLLLVSPVSAETKKDASSQKESSLFSVGIAPSTIFLSVSPSQSVVETLSIKNLTKTPIDASVYVKDFKSIDNYGNIEIYSDKDPNKGVESWILYQNLSNKIIHLVPNGSYNIVYQISVPNGAYSGTHSAIIFVQPNIAINSPTGASIAGRVGSNLIINVSGNQKPTSNIGISDFNISKFNFFRDPSGGAIVNNKGTFIAPLKITLDAQNIFQKESIRLDNMDVLPNSSRYIMYNKNVKWDLSSLNLFGYSATLSVTNLATNQSVKKKGFVFIFNIFSLLVLLVFTSFIALIIKFIRKRRNI